MPSKLYVYRSCRPTYGITVHVTSNLHKSDKFRRIQLRILVNCCAASDRTSMLCPLNSMLCRIIIAKETIVSKSLIVVAERKSPKTLGWTFHGSRYCQLIRNANNKKRVQWVKDNLHSSFDDVVWTDGSTIQLENNWMFLYQKVGSAPKLKPWAKHPFKIMV